MSTAPSIRRQGPVKSPAYKPGPAKLPKPNKVKKPPPPAPPRTVSLTSDDDESEKNRGRSKSLGSRLDNIVRPPDTPVYRVTHLSRPLPELLQEITLPSLIRVTKGYQGYHEEDSLSEQEVFIAETFIQTRVVVGVDNHGKKVTIPTNSALMFTPVREEDDLTSPHNVECHSISDLLELQKLPLAVVATRDNDKGGHKQSFSAKEVIFPLNVVKSKGLRGKKTLIGLTAGGRVLELPSDTVGGFLTNPVDAAVSIGDILKFINGNFPIKVLIQEDDTNRSQKVVMLTGIGKEVTFVLKTLHPGENGKPSYFEVPCDWPIEAECVKDKTGQRVCSTHKFDVSCIRRRFNPLDSDTDTSTFQGVAYLKVEYGTGEYSLHTTLQDIGGLGVVAKRQSPFHPPLPSNDTRTSSNPLVEERTHANCTPNSRSTGQYVEIDITSHETPPTQVKPSSATLPRNMPKRLVVMAAQLDSHQDYVDMTRAAPTKSVVDDTYEYIPAYKNCIDSFGGSVGTPVTSMGGSTPRVAAHDPYIRALQEENKRLETSVKTCSERVRQLECENIDLRTKGRHVKSSPDMITPPKRDSGHFLPLPPPDPISHTPREEDQHRKSNLSYIASLDEDQVVDLLMAMNLQDYIDVFRREGIDGALLVELTLEELQQLGVNSGLHLKKFKFLLDGRTSAYQKLTRLAGKSA